MVLPDAEVSDLVVGKFGHRSGKKLAFDFFSGLVRSWIAFADLSIRWSVTGGPAAHALQKCYRGLELPIFVDSFPDQLRRRLRILTDKSGPLILLRWQPASPASSILITAATGAP
jgi:hypothetical protein